MVLFADYSNSVLVRLTAGTPRQTSAPFRCVASTNDQTILADQKPASQTVRARNSVTLLVTKHTNKDEIWIDGQGQIPILDLSTFEYQL